MSEPPLVIPFLPDAQVGGALPVAPVCVAAWMMPSTAGPSKRLALAGSDNTIWICTSRVTPASTLLAPPDLSLAGSARPSPTTTHSFTHDEKRRPRASSTSSSIITNYSSRRVASFSPSSSTTTLIQPSLSSATATAASTVTSTATPLDDQGKRHRNSFSGRTELLDTLREQADADDRAGLGIGLSGLTRRSLNIQSKEELESAAASAPPSSSSTTAGASAPKLSPVTQDPVTPRSGSGESSRRSSRLGFWSRADDDQVKEAKAEEEKAKLNEMAVEAKMVKQEAHRAKAAEDMATVAAVAATHRKPVAFPTSSTKASTAPETDTPPVRIVLPEPGRGSIVDLAVLEEVDELVILRDVGLLDVVSLTSLQLTKHLSLDHVAPPGGRVPQLALSWLWRRVHLAAREEGAMMIANAEPWPTVGPSPNGEVTRVAMLGLPSHDCVATLELPGIGDVGVASDGDASYLLHATATSVMSYPITFPSDGGGSGQPSPSATPRPSVSPTSPSATSPVLRPDHPRRPGALASVRQASQQSGLAKFLAARRISHKKPAPEEHHKPVQAGIEAGSEVPRNGGGHWTSVRLHDNGQGLGLGDDHVDAFEFDGSRLTMYGALSVKGKVKDAVFTAGWHDVCVVTDADTTVFARDGPLKAQQTQTWVSRQTYPARAACISAGALHAVEAEDVINVDLGSLEKRTEVSLCAPTAGEHLCPLGADALFAADESGNVRKQPLGDFLAHKPAQDDVLTADRLPAPVTFSTLIKSDLADGGRFLVAGDDDGEVRIWDAKDLRLRGSWTLFDDPVRSATLLDMPQAGSLNGSLLLISERGTVAVISLQDMDQLLLIPAARAPLTRIFMGDEDIMLAYENAKARVWNLETREFRRSTGLDAADDMLTADWAEVRYQTAPVLDSPVTKVVGATPLGSDLGRLLQLDLRHLGQWIRETADPLPALRGLLSVFLTFGVNSAIDEVCRENLGIEPPKMPIAIGWEGPHGTASVTYPSPTAAWRVSPTATGLRQIAIVSLLRPFLDAPEHERYAADVIAYYTASLPEDAAEAPLQLFAAFYLDSAADVHQAARMLFGARLSCLPNDEIEAIVAANQAKLPSVVPSEQSMSETAARALTMVGGMALHRFSSMTPSALKAVAESIDLYLHDPHQTHVSLAIELCSKGFANWQTFVDPMNLLRQLFYLSTHKDTPTSVSAQARLAVLHVASFNAPLFMSTLSMDILDARTVEGRTSIMKLCVFMARKRPAVLEAGLPRIAEAVVKSLDPNVGKMRDDVWEAATVILNELVSAFKTIDFNPSGQRLAVGTNEGAVIMYDLKTASKLYVLEAHNGPVSALAFSPDGRRLVTVSLADCTVTVWKVGSSLSGLFNVGGPPRQGRERGEPYKRIPFVLPENDRDENMGALSDVQIAWRGNRQALVTIKDTAFNFETT